MDKIALQIFTGNRIYTFRKAKHLSKKTVAEQLNIKQGILSKYEKGILAPKQDCLLQLAEIFDIQLEEFFPPL